MHNAENINENYYEKWAEQYDLLYYKYAVDIPLYTEAAKNAGGKVLEVACGTGRIYLELLKAGVDAYGFDLSGEMLKVLKQKAADLKLTPRVKVADMRNFRFNQKFTLIIIPFRAFLHNLTADDQLRTLRSCRSHLAPGGKLMLNFFFPDLQVLAESNGKDVRIRYNIEGKIIDHITNARYVDELEQVVEITECLKKRGKILWKGSARMALIYKKEFELLLRLSGFRRWQLFFGFDCLQPPSTQQEMVWIIEK